ncbi:MAG: 50S ribosomal protein L35 [Deltaproteobacteria bacterium]|nr:50S ribosomal protein L35 [Deltaproteobacteria bacterium]MBW2306212.1 50S ribosomal protein L35 [Deltaproteobacteria bacterium]
MPKLKSNRGAVKRFSYTGGGKIKRAHANRSHILTKKRRGRKRNLRKSALINAADFPAIRRLIPYG